MEPEDRIFQEIAASKDLDLINLPPSPEFFMTTNNNAKLHVRSYWPSVDNSLLGVVVVLHGYNSHINRPAHRVMSDAITNAGYAYVGFDYIGHGYSTGQRACISDKDQFVNSAVGVVSALYEKDSRDPNGRYFIDKQSPVQSSTPLYIMGQSMGGPLTIVVSTRIREALPQINLQGNILLCPAIGVKSPPLPIRWLMDYIISPLFPDTPIPAMLSHPMPDSAAWTSKEYVRYILNDRTSVNGLTSNDGMCFATAGTILALSEEATSLLPNIDYPLLLFHDPADKVVSIDSAHLVMNSVRTLSEEQTLVTLDNAAHDLLSNRTGIISRTIVEWLLLHNQKEKP
jgi:alpha-beta hydrolase superfamily lysophospholipase